MDRVDKINQSGFLEVGDGHSLYWEDWGNPTATPILHIHGGPGGGFRDTHKLTFSSSKNRVIFYDQRGAGRSTPFAETTNNTTQDLVGDIEKLRAHLVVDRFHIFGGSWGSTLSLLYAISYPEQVKSLTLWGVYLATQFENDFIAGGYARYNYPQEWERFISLVPESERTSGASITRFYSEKMNTEDIDSARKYADEWALWESCLLSINYCQQKLINELMGDDNNLPLAKLETQYFLNNCYIPENYIIDNIQEIKQIPCFVVQGRFDNCTPPASAYKLKKAYGENMTLQLVNAGHVRFDPELFAVLAAAASRLI